MILTRKRFDFNTEVELIYSVLRLVNCKRESSLDDIFNFKNQRIFQKCTVVPSLRSRKSLSKTYLESRMSKYLLRYSRARLME